MNNERLLKLIMLYKAKELSEDESIELNQWIEESEGNHKEFMRLTDSAGIKHYMQSKIRIARVMRDEKTPVRRIAYTYYFRRMAAVAAVLIVIAGLYMWRSGLDGTKPAAPQTQQQLSKNDVAPGKYRAMLQLSDGRQVVLDSAGNGLLAQQGQTNIYSEGGTLKYSPEGSASETLFNTLKTATGETFALTLSDGSRVWLNSQSSIKFPVSFNGPERNVEVQGEVYFEVSKNAKHPFKVKVNSDTGKSSEVQVLGTHFNINAYPDEPLAKTTLLEGRVAIKSGITGSNSKFLSPGQQASLDEKGIIKVISNVNTDAVIAWKANEFNFSGDDIQTIMRQFSRWYGITVNYEGSIPERRFGGMISRNRNLSEVLKMLESNNIHFKIEGKQLTVIP